MATKGPDEIHEIHELDVNEIDPPGADPNEDQYHKTIAKGGTVVDSAEMHRMGRVQELRRNFKFVSIVGFVTILQATWECTLLANWPGLLNGGTGGIIWCTIAVWFFMIGLIASIAEMASMAPNSGGQYHWVSEFAPPSTQKPLSYIVGWASTVGWIAGIPACTLQMSGMIQAMVAIGNPETAFVEDWQITLLVWAFTMLTIAFNIFCSHQLPFAEGIILFLHILAFFAFLITFWIMADHAPAHDVFFNFYNGGGWPTKGLSCMIGLTSPIWCFIGPDAGAHMSEELKDASIQLPKAMMWSIVLNGIMGVTMLISFCFCIHNVDTFVNLETDYPLINVLYNATGSLAATYVMGTILLVLLFFSTVTTVASSSRQIWSFSRDHGFPYSNWIRQVVPGWDIPVNSLIVALVVSMILAAINFGSNVALNAILSVSNAALLLSYIVSIGALRLRRLQGKPLLARRWSLGKWGGPINDITLAFLVVTFFFSFWPSYVLTGDPTALADFNWAIVVLVIVGILAYAYYFFGGGERKYIGPVQLVRRD